MSVESLRARAVSTFVTRHGDEIAYRRLTALDVSDIPHAWTLYNLGIYFALQSVQTENPKPERTPWIDQYDKASKEFDERKENQILLICRAATSPRVVDPATIKGDIPDDAIAYYSLDQYDINRFANEIIVKLAGLDATEQEVEAQRLSRFPDGSDVRDGDAGGQSIGGEGRDVTGDHGPVDIPSVDDGGGGVGVEDEGAPVAGSNAEAGA